MQGFKSDAPQLQEKDRPTREKTAESNNSQEEFEEFIRRKGGPNKIGSREIEEWIGNKHRRE